VGEHVFLKVKAKISSLRLGSCPKLATRYCGPFEILEKMGSIAYMLVFSSSMRVHNVFHVSLLKKYVHDPNHIIDKNVIQVEHEGDFRVEPVCILDSKVKLLGNKDIGLVKVQWIHYSPKDATNKVTNLTRSLQSSQFLEVTFFTHVSKNGATGSTPFLLAPFFVRWLKLELIEIVSLIIVLTTILLHKIDPQIKK
jgi:hypothetical protein